MIRKNKLSLLIPAYNEGKIIERTLKRVIKFLSKKRYGWEVIVVDDGSNDKTAIIAEKFNKSGVKVAGYLKNRGKGGALKEGIKSASGEYIIFSDADLSVDIEKIDEVLDKLKKVDIVIASRRIKGSNILVHQPFLRELMGRVYTFLTKVVTGVNLPDFTCGFKGFRAVAAKKIFSKTLINRWAYDSEILFLAKKFNYKLSQIPVTWKNREDTRVVLKNVILESIKDLISIRINNLLGKYNS